MRQESVRPQRVVAVQHVLEDREDELVEARVGEEQGVGGGEAGGQGVEGVSEDGV